ncbi:histidine phosphatase family protein [Thiocapsa imhoffii]|uniref:Histidine phosphatase family protein n=1 Tax=Thiocapsa imhoffii TaxID=382777 RepID=A0A9X1B803_9GAMM|nr:histidine phosphatase family protein [Thiocapsa imhoffii]MBK1644267.1 histidine phosphatase family protein [Thiocapsa imhoffii]
MNDSNPSNPNEPAAICVVRHGETDWNVTGVLQGWIDVPLNETGSMQSRMMAERWRDAGFTCIWTSPLQRAAQTAEILAVAWGLPPPRANADLKERHFGRIEGMSKREIARRHPGLHEGIVRRDPACEFEQGESLEHFVERVQRGVGEIARQHPGEAVLLVTHGWVMDVLTRQIMGLPIDQTLEMKRKNGEALWLRVTPGLILPQAPMV